MGRSRLMIAIAVLAAVGVAAPVQAQRHRGGGSAGPARGVSRPGGAVGRAVPRDSVPMRPPVTGPYRRYGHYPYYSPYRGVGLGFNHYGYPFGYLGYGYPGYSYGYGYGYGYGADGSGGYGYGNPGYITTVPSQGYGRLRIQDAPRDAQVFADGYYVGVVNDFDGAFQYLNLEVGVHQIEIRAPGFETLTLDVNAQPGQTITYRARMRAQQP